MSDVEFFAKIKLENLESPEEDFKGPQAAFPKDELEIVSGASRKISTRFDGGIL